MPDSQASSAPSAEPPLAVVAAVMALAGVRRGHALADLASGAGRWTRAAAAAVTSSGRVFAFAPTVASYGGALSREADPSWAPVHRSLALPDALPLPAQSLDGALWVTDPMEVRERAEAAVLAELRRVVRPGCRVVVSFAGSSASAPVWLLAEHGFSVAHVSDERWGVEPLVLVAARRA
ncbi:MAG TPA: hypothetical protein VNA14_03240 [Mycobacteriales bacterium]|nr:hypothetical protein [Mycobacteriales bacterium]